MRQIKILLKYTDISVRKVVNLVTKKNIHAVVRAFSKQYKQASKKAKSELLNRLVKTTGYSRKHLMEILPTPPKVRKRKRRIQKSHYLQILKSLRTLWAVSNYACGKRLKSMIPTLLAALRRHKELHVTKDERLLLLKISASTR